MTDKDDIPFVALACQLCVLLTQVQCPGAPDSDTVYIYVPLFCSNTMKWYQDLSIRTGAWNCFVMAAKMYHTEHFTDSCFVIPDSSDRIVFCSGLRSAENRAALFSALPGNLKQEGGATAYDAAALPHNQTSSFSLLTTVKSPNTKYTMITLNTNHRNRLKNRPLLF